MSLEAAAITIRALLFADVFANLLQLETHRGHCVSTGPEVLAREIPLFATQAGHRYGALPFQKSDHRGHRILRRNRDAHVHMVRQQVSLNDLALLLPRQCVKYFSQLASCLAKQHLAPPLRASHIMRTFLTRSRFTILGTLSLESLYAFSGGGKIVMENTSFANFLIRPSFVCPAGCAVRSAPSSP